MTRKKWLAWLLLAVVLGLGALSSCRKGYLKDEPEQGEPEPGPSPAPRPGLR